MGTWLAVATETGDLRKVKVEFTLEPVDGVSWAAGEDVDEVVAGKITGLKEHALRSKNAERAQDR